MKNLLLMFSLVLSVMIMQGQNTKATQQRGADKQQTTVNQDKVPTKVLNTFKQNFPNAKKVIWNKYRNYYEASYMQDNKNYMVSIAPNGEWIQTAITGSMNELPGEVREQFQSGEYATYEVRNIRELSSTGIEKIYMIEVVSADQENKPVYLYYEPSGSLYRLGTNPFVAGSPVIRSTKATEVSREELPPLVENAFMEVYPDVTDVRWRKEKNRYIGDYSDKGKRMYFITSEEGEWQETASEYNFQQLPQPVQDAYNKAGYKDWEIYNAEYISPAYNEDETNVKFRLHMYKLNPDDNYAFKTLTYDPRGNLLNVDQ